MRTRNAMMANKGSKEAFAAIAFGVVVGVFIVLALTGGASRSDEPLLLFDRMGLLIGLLVLTALPIRAKFEGLRSLLILLSLFALWMAIQLVPLPNSVWRALPGNDRWAPADLLIGAQPWRPISLVPEVTFNALIALITPFVVLLGLAMSGPEKRRAIPFIITALALASAVLAMIQAAAGLDSFYVRAHAVSGFMANRNHQGLLLAIGIPMAALWALWPSVLRMPAGLKIAIGIFCIILFAGMILVTGSRAGLVLGAMGLASIPFLTPPHLRSGINKWYIAILFAILALFIIAIVYFGRDLALTRLQAMHELSEEGRLRRFPIMWEIAKDFFPFGVGTSVFDPVFRSYEPDWALSTNYFNRAHNDWLDLLLGGGAAAIVLLGALIILLVSKLTQQWKIGEQRAGAIAIAVALGQIAAASVVDYPLRTPLFAGIFTLLAVITVEPAPQLPRKRSPQG